MDVLHQAETDDSIAAVVLTGAGKYFTSGADLSNTSDFETIPTDSMRNRPAGRFMFAILNFKKILACAVNGPVVGIGVPLLLHCDVVFFSDTATLWAPFARLALIPEFCGSVLLRATHGMAKANELLLLGTRLNAQQAVEYNFGSRVIANCNPDPFHPNSLANTLCNALNKKLLSLPLGSRTAHYFSSMVKGRHREYLKQLCTEELNVMDERFKAGDVRVAARQVAIGRSKL